MNLNPIWPAAPAEIVLWTQLVSVWAVASYFIVIDWTTHLETVPALRTEIPRLAAAVILAAAASLMLPPPGTSEPVQIGLAVLVGLLVVITYGVRRAHLQSGKRSWLAEIEAAAILAAILATGVIVGLGQVGASPRDPIVRGGKPAAILLVIAGLIFVFRAGTSIVRGVLERIGAQPTDREELNRGRSIGNLERLLMVTVVAIGQYEALGFIIAAKGLIRAREFEDRRFAEYFIAGSLSSGAVALSVGIALRFVVPILWRS